jgi:Ca-activated chloride channel family protein|tara:strand:+ start:1786 stop:2946 length:1161 start_codon:yes stop_codon:yes gene_type:complete
MTINKKKYYFKTSNAIIGLIIVELLFWITTISIYQYLSLNVTEFRFEHPGALWLLLIIVLLNILWIKNKIWKKKAISNFAEINTLSKIFNGFSNNRSSIKFFTFRIAIGLLIIAAANPQYGENERTVESKGIDIMVALDISKSMMAEDLVPDYNRLDIAKLAIGKLMNELRGDHVGIVVFAGEAYKQLPLTPDYQVAKLFLKSVGSDMISSQGTDIGNAIELCMSSFSEDRKTNKAIVIISDGEDHEEMAVNAAKDASENGVVICTVGMGSEKGVPIPIIRNGKKVGIKKDQDELTVLTKLNEENLIQIAEAGNGTYTKTKGLSLDLRKILDRINKIEKTSLKKDRYSTYDDQFQWFLFPGLLLLLLEFVIFEKRGKIDDQLVLFK